MGRGSRERASIIQPKPPLPLRSGVSSLTMQVALAFFTGAALEAVGAPGAGTPADPDSWKPVCVAAPCPSQRPPNPTPEVTAEAVPPAPPGWQRLPPSHCSLAHARPFRSGLRASSHALRPLGAGPSRRNKYPGFPFRLHLPLRVPPFCRLCFYTRRSQSRVRCQEDSSK